MAGLLGFLPEMYTLCGYLQDEVDDLVNDEAEDVVDTEDMQRVYRRTAAERQQQDMDPEALDAYIKQRFEQPAAMYREEIAGGAPAGAFWAFARILPGFAT